MSGSTKLALAIATALTAAACADFMNSPGDSVELSPAFRTIPVGFSANSNSFTPDGDAGMPFYPETMVGIGFHGGSGNSGSNSGPGRGNGDGRDDKHDGFGRGIRGLLMGGGLGPDFIGAIAFGKGKDRGPFGVFNLPDACTFSAETGRVTCPPRERHDLTVNMSFAFKDVNGVAQPTFDAATTDLVNVQTDVSGTKTRHDGAVTSTLSHESDRTVTGLAAGSSERVVNGTAEAHENTSGTREEIEFTAEREAYDTTSNLVIPIREGRPTIPSAGTVIRRMRVTITKDGGEPRTKFRRERVTFDGTNVVKVEITQDEVTRNCTLTLPEKKLACED
jgi:hypothetical protein